MDDVDKILAGLRVLAVDDDHVCLKILEMQLRYCKYDVTAVTHAETALEMLRARKDGDQFDLVISDVHMPDMDGFKFLELVGLEMDIPVILLSANEETETMMKGIKHGACGYLLKPVHLDRLKNIWLHVVKKGCKNDPRNHISGTNSDADQEHHQPSVTEGEKGGADDDTNNCSRKNRKDDVNCPEDDSHQNTRSSAGQKKQRIQWTGPLHRKFVEVVHQIGIDRAVPKKIWEMMNVDGISREHVASHLQKYRLGLKRLSLVTHKQSNPFPAGSGSWRRDWNYINMNRLNSSPSALGLHRLLHSPRSVQPMSSQRNLAIPLIRPAGRNSNLFNDVSNIRSSGKSYGNASNGGLSSGHPFFASPSDGYIGNVPNCMALKSSRSLPCAIIPGNSFAHISNGTQPLDAGLCNSRNPVASSVFPGHGQNAGISVGPSQGNILAINQLSGHALVRTSAAVVGFSEPITPFNLGSNTKSTSAPNDNSAVVSASSINSALPSIQIDDYDVQTQMLNGGGGNGILPEKDGSVDQHAVGDLMGTSEAQNQMSDDLDDIVADWLNRGSQNLDAVADVDWKCF